VPQPAGMQTRAILRCTVNVQNGHPERDWWDGRSGRFTEGCEAVGYQIPTSGYAHISFFNIHEVAGQTVGDTLTLDVGFAADACDHCSAKGHLERAPITRAVVRLDPNMHDHPPDPGELLWKADGAAAEGYHRNLTVDLTGVAAGEHKLLLRVEQPDTILGNTNIGQLTVPFTKAATNAEVTR
jgi:hypothetical protein